MFARSPQASAPRSPASAPTVPAVDGEPNVLPVDSENGRANHWHTDVTFVLNPPQASTLRSIVTVAGDVPAGIEGRRNLFIVTSLMAGVAVAVSGVIGFVGLVVPHIVRLAVGSDHRRVLPVGVLFGASFEPHDRSGVGGRRWNRSPEGVVEALLIDIWLVPSMSEPRDAQATVRLEDQTAIDELDRVGVRGIQGDPTVEVMTYARVLFLLDGNSTCRAS